MSSIEVVRRSLDAKVNIVDQPIEWSFSGYFCLSFISIHYAGGCRVEFDWLRGSIIDIVISRNNFYVEMIAIEIDWRYGKI